MLQEMNNHINCYLDAGYQKIINFICRDKQKGVS